VPLVTSLLLIVAAAGALIWQGDLLQHRAMAQREVMVTNNVMTNIVLDHKYLLPDCTPHQTISPLAIKFCRATDTDLEREGPLLVLWGDSHVRGWRPVFAEIARERGLRLVIFDHPGCAPLVNVWRKDFYCSPAIVEDILQSIAALGANQVVLISQWDVYSHGVTTTSTERSERYFLTEVENGDSDTNASLEIFSRQFPATVQRLRATGAQVLILKAPPMLNEASISGFVRHPATFEPSLAQHRERSAFSSRLIDELAQQLGVKALDLAPGLCDEKCRASRDEVLYYSDENHLTAMACLTFKPQLQALLIDPAQATGH